MVKMRLDKFLADQLAESRGDLKKEIRKFGVMVNEDKEKDPGRIIDSDKDLIVFRGQKVEYMKFIYIMLNKPAGLLSAVSDTREPTVIDHVMSKYPRKDYFPAGRLDKDSEGLLLITNDGQLAHGLLSPKKNIEKKYYLEVNGRLTEDELLALENEVVLEDGYKCKPAKAELLFSDKSMTKLYLTITEGKFHQVKRMIKAVGFEVSYLKRVEMGPLKLDPSLKTGDFRLLEEDEIRLLKEVL